MRLETISIKNFRCYRKEITVQFNDLTTFVGKNDIGKSSVLEALEIFFNTGTIKIEQNDANVYSQDHNVTITCEFSCLPPTLNLDAGAETTLSDEYLLTTQGTLKIRKVYDCNKKTPGTEIFIIAQHPTAEGVDNLLELKERDLQQIVKKKNLDVSLKGNPSMRRAIWAAEPDLQLKEMAIPITKPKEDCKRIWEQLERYLPMYALFQSDRSSRDSDDEVQNPMKAAVAAAIVEVQDEIDQIQTKVRKKAEEIAHNTYEVLKTLDDHLAKDLKPKFIPPTPAKWTGLFSVSMDTDDGIPLNKRGSGVRRLVLVSFFKAEAERKLRTGSKGSVIYAIEEPETAQHPNNQKILIDSFKALATHSDCQVILTTHSPGFAGEMSQDSIRFVNCTEDGNTKIDAGVDAFGVVAETLGVIPDSRVKVLFYVEGPTDVTAFKCLSRALHFENSSIPDLSVDERVAFVVVGGGTLKHWVNEHYLKSLNLPEFHIFDSDVSDYAKKVKQINERKDGSWAVQTKKYEIENYLHPDAIKDAFGVDMIITDRPADNEKAVPKLFSKALFALNPIGCPIKDNTAKLKLAEQAFPLMTAARIRERDQEGEVEGWFHHLAEMINK